MDIDDKTSFPALIIKINETLSLKNGQNSRERNVRFSSFANKTVLREHARWLVENIKALANEDTLLRTHCCRHKCFPVCLHGQHYCCGHKFVSGTQTFFWFCSETFCVRNKCFPVCAAQETSWATMCPQQCVLICQGLNSMETQN